jgi:hypothetical protein
MILVRVSEFVFSTYCIRVCVFLSEFYGSENVYFKIIAFTIVGVRIEKKNLINDSIIFITVQFVTTNKF